MLNTKVFILLATINYNNYNVMLNIMYKYKYIICLNYSNYTDNNILCFIVYSMYILDRNVFIVFNLSFWKKIFSNIFVYLRRNFKFILFYRVYFSVAYKFCVEQFNLNYSIYILKIVVYSLTFNNVYSTN